MRERSRLKARSTIVSMARSGAYVEALRSSIAGHALLVVVFLVAGCSPNGHRGPETTLRVGFGYEPQSLNPLLGALTVDNFLADLAFDGLVTVDSSGKIVPDLATEIPSLQNGGISSNGLVIRYRLRKNVRWQDGAPFTSEDVRFSWQAVMNPHTNVNSRVAYDDVASVETTNPYSVVFHLKRPYAPFVALAFSAASGYRILPSHLLARYPDLNHVDFNGHPIGTGPFQVVRWDRGNFVEYVANMHYFLGKPKLQHLRVYFVQDPTTLENEIRTHDLDLVPELGASQAHSLRSVAGFRVVEVPAPVIAGLVLNVSHPALRDVRVRRAIAYAVDRQQIIHDITFGIGEVAAANIPPYYRWAYTANVRHYAYDEGRAELLLDEAGWTRGRYGVRTRMGAPLSLEIAMYSAGQTTLPIALLVQAALRKVGIDATIKTYPADILNAPNSTGILRSGSFDITPRAWIIGADPDDSTQWLCSEVAPAGQNLSRYCNPRLDALETTALTHDDRPTRMRAYHEIQQILANDVPIDFLYYRGRLSVVSAALRNYDPSGLSLGWGAYRWSW